MSKTKLWAGRILVGLPTLFLTWDAIMKVVLHPQVLEASAKMGFHRTAILFIGCVELLAVILLWIRRTRVFGAVLLSAFFGGAVELHVRMSDPLFSHTLFPIYFAAFIWGGLYLLDARVRALSPFRPAATAGGTLS